MLCWDDIKLCIGNHKSIFKNTCYILTEEMAEYIILAYSDKMFTYIPTSVLYLNINNQNSRIQDFQEGKFDTCRLVIVTCRQE